jgi:hypothetical protein
MAMGTLPGGNTLPEKSCAKAGVATGQIEI